MKKLSVIHTPTLNATSVGWLSPTVLVSGGTDKTIKKWDSTTGQRIGVDIVFQSPVEVLQCLEGKIFAGCQDGSLWLTDNTIQTGFGRITELVVSQNNIAIGATNIEDGKTVNRVAVYDRQGGLVWFKTTGNFVYGLAFSETGDRLYIGEGQPDGGVLYVRSVATGDVTDPGRIAAVGSITDLARFGSELAVASLNAGSPVDSVVFCHLTDLNQFASIPHQFLSGVWSIGYSCDGVKVGVASNDYDVWVFARDTGAQIYKASSVSIGSKLSWHPTNPQLFAVSRRHGEIEIHDLQPEPVTPPPAPPTTGGKPGKGPKK